MIDALLRRFESRAIGGQSASTLATLSAAIAMVQWVFLLLFATAMVDEDSATENLEALAFFGWPAAAALALAANNLVRHRPMVAAGLLLVVAAALAYPAVIGGLVALAGAVSAYLARKSAPEPEEGGVLAIAGEIARSLGLFLWVVAAFFVIAMVGVLRRAFG